MRGCRPLTDEEIARVMQQFRGRHGRRDSAFFLLGLKTGLRCKELIGLRVGDVWNGAVLGRVNVRRQTVKGRRSGFSIPLHHTAASALKDYLTSGRRGAALDAPLFLSAKHCGGRPRPLDRSAAYRRLKCALRQAGVHGYTGVHSLRKTYCEKIYRRLGNDLIATQAAMHHSSITSTIRYLSFDQQQIEAAILAA